MEPQRRRRRPAVSCTLCRKRKLRCNRERPCRNCVKSRNGVCSYDGATHPPVATTRPSQSTVPISDTSSTNPSTLPSNPSSIHLHSSTIPSTPRTQSSGRDTESTELQLRVRELEEELRRTKQTNAQSSLAPKPATIEIVTTELGGPLHIHHDEKTGAFARHVTSKSRLFGQSHWVVNSVAMISDIFTTLTAPSVREEAKRIYKDVDICKAMARTIKAKRVPSWPCLPTRDLPSKEMSDLLVQGYLQTVELVYRILHVPSFQSDYEALWVSSSRPDMAFVMQLKLVLALGAVCYDETFSMRTEAIRWVYEVQTWLSEPKYKSRLGIQSVQTNLLLLLAQERVGVRGDPMWISMGSLKRKAMSMGLHRDPVHLPTRTMFAAEMRRRLWNTILELSLQSSLVSGGAPLLNLDDFDTAPPANLDDDQLLSDESLPKSVEEYTQTSISIALRRVLPQRLAVIKFLNDFSSNGEYQDVLRLDGDLRIAYKSLVKTLQAHKYSNSGRSPSEFEHRAVDVLIHRYLAILHVSWFRPALQNVEYAFSRKIAVDASVRIWHAVFPPGQQADLHLRRLAICSSGFYPTLLQHTSLIVMMELRAQVTEDQGLSPTLMRPDLVSILDEAMPWCLKVIEAGETNIKGYILSTLVSSQIEGLRQGLGTDAMAAKLFSAMSTITERCMAILQHSIESLGGQVEEPVSDQVEETEDWGFLATDIMFTPGSTDPMMWMMDDGLNGGPALW